MNKEILDQLPADEQPVAAKLNSTAENMKVPQTFQWTLESQLMNAYENKSKPTNSWFPKIIATAGWAALAIGGFILFNWGIRSLVPSEQITPGASNNEVSFKTQVRQGSICTGPLALAHGFSVSLTSQDKTGFITLDESKAIGELRSFVWSADGSQLALLGNTTGSGNIYLTDPNGASLQPVMSNSQLGYTMGFAPSQDGKRFVMWSGQNNTVVNLVNADGTGLKEIQLEIQILDTPQFSPDDQSIIFYGADTTSAGLFQFSLDGSQTRMISNRVEDETGFAFSPDGSLLAYFEMDRDLGEARLVAEEFVSGDKTTLATLPIPKGSGSSLPDVANLSWLQNGSKLVFEFGRNAADRAIYIANADGSGMVKMVDSAYAPTISSDGNCLAYIRDKQVFIIDLANSSSAPLFLADLPSGRSTSNFRLDKLQWSP